MMPTQRHKTKSHFENELHTMHVYGKFVITTKPLRYRYGPGENDFHEVPKYKLTDQASEPWWAGSIGLVGADIEKLGVLHDDVCDAFYSSRMLADAYLYDGALAIGKSYLQGLALYYGVRIGNLFRYKTEIPKRVIEIGRMALAKEYSKPAVEVIFNPERNIYEIN